MADAAHQPDVNVSFVVNYCLKANCCECVFVFQACACTDGDDVHGYPRSGGL